MDSYDVIAEAVKDYWKANYPQDVVAFFQQKYSWDDKWERCEELVECHESNNYENMTFLSDFCEGQTEVKDVVIIPLREVTAFYYERKIERDKKVYHGEMFDPADYTILDIFKYFPEEAHRFIPEAIRSWHADPEYYSYIIACNTEEILNNSIAKKTNGFKIRDMSNDELAEWFLSVCCGSIEHSCSKCPFYTLECTFKDWLKQEVKE